MKKNRKTIALNEELYEMLDYIAQKQHEEWDTPSKNLTYTISIMIKSSYKNYKNKYGSKSTNKDKEQEHQHIKITKVAIKENENWKESLEDEIMNWKESL